MTGALASLAFLVSLMALLFGLISVVRPFRRTPVNNRWKAAGLAVISFLAAAIIAHYVPQPASTARISAAPGLAPTVPAERRAVPAAPPASERRPTPSPIPEPPPLERLAAAARDLHGVTEAKADRVNKVLELNAKGDRVEDALKTVERVVHLLQDDSAATRALNVVTVTLVQDDHDRLGYPTTEPTLKLWLSASDLARVRWDALTARERLALATDVAVLSPVGADALTRFCGSKFQPGPGRSICQP